MWALSCLVPFFTLQSAAEELDEFLGESSEPASDDVAGRDRRKIAKAINPVALAAATQHRGKMFGCLTVNDAPINESIDRIKHRSCEASSRRIALSFRGR